MPSLSRLNVLILPQARPAGCRGTAKAAKLLAFFSLGGSHIADKESPGQGAHFVGCILMKWMLNSYKHFLLKGASLLADIIFKETNPYLRPTFSVGGGKAQEWVCFRDSDGNNITNGPA